MLIGLTGYDASSRQAIADILTDTYSFEQHAFVDLADALLEAIGSPVNVTTAELAYATRGVLGDDVWVARTLSNVNPRMNSVISDVTTPTEADAIEAVGGQLWRVLSTTNIGDTALDNRPVDRTILNRPGALDGLVMRNVRSLDLT